MPSVEITIGNSYSQIKGITAEQFRGLRKLLSYEADPSAVYFSGGYSRPKYLIDKQGNFPTGLLNRVLIYFKTALNVNINDTRVRPASNPGMFKLKLEN